MGLNSQTKSTSQNTTTTPKILSKKTQQNTDANTKNQKEDKPLKVQIDKSCLNLSLRRFLLSSFSIKEMNLV